MTSIVNSIPQTTPHTQSNSHLHPYTPPPLHNNNKQEGGLGSLKGFTYFFSAEPDTAVLLDRLQWVLLASLSGELYAVLCVAFWGGCLGGLDLFCVLCVVRVLRITWQNTTQR